MKFGEWLDSLPEDAMISGVDDTLTRTENGLLRCSAYWWSPSEMRADMWEDLAEEGVPVTLGQRKLWMVKIRTGEFRFSWATLEVPG